MAATLASGAAANPGLSLTRTITITDALPADTRLNVFVGINERGRVVTATFDGQPMTLTQEMVNNAGAQKVAGHSSQAFELLLEDDAPADAQLVVTYATRNDAVAIVNLRPTIVWIAHSGIGPDFYLFAAESDSSPLSTGAKTITAPVVPSPADSLEVSAVIDQEDDQVGPEYGTSDWSVSAGVTKVVQDLNTTSARPQLSSAVAVDYTPLAVAGTRGERLWTATNETGVIRSAWTLVYAPVNARPIANAGPNLEVEPFAPFEINASASTDDTGIASYAITQTSGPAVDIEGDGPVWTVAQAPADYDGATLGFEVVATDEEGAVSDPSTATVTVLPANEMWRGPDGWTPMSIQWPTP